MSEQKKQTPEVTNEVEKKPAPWVRLASAYYQNDLGEHPKNATGDLYSLDPVLDELIEEHLIDYALPIIPCIDGHNVMTTNGIADILENNIKVPLSPNFVRDLAGRIIYIGYGPEVKKGEHWTNNRHVTFPNNCRIVTTDIEGSEYIENIFFTRFRSLDTSMRYESDAHLQLFSYEAENLYPYKLRVDTFYQDGWRLPQTALLYARKSVDKTHAKNIGLKFLEEWGKVSSTTFYAEFLEMNGGAEWVEKLFQSGCTVIPTTDAYNSFYVVDDEYGIKKRRSGRAVEGLHDIVSAKASEEPKDTILEVIAPGFTTSNFIYPAQVIVSDGKRYESNMKAFPIPVHPDLRLPHQRTQSVWGATWLPTHPSHFEEPSIWVWDMATGHFMQKKGPLWDPLHYYYDSVPLIIKAFKYHEPISRQISYVPQYMKERFFPATAIKGFDMMSYGIKKMRKEKNILPLSGLLRVKDTKFSSNVGYHPLPLAFEYELSNLWFPELLPQGRTRAKPAKIVLAPVISCNTNINDYQNNAGDVNEFDRLKLPGLLKESSGDPLTDYPQLHRYLSEFNTGLANTYGRIILNMPEETVKGIHSLYDRDSLDEIIEATEMPFYKAVKGFSLKSLENLNKTIEKYNSDLTSFTHKHWKGR
ncbi:MAG: hypothetical protein ACI9TY_000394 [Alphaproteobacteria bacterium]|jgi:hypothetical protein